VLIWDRDGRVLLIHEAYVERRYGLEGDFVAKDNTPFHGFFFEAEIMSGMPTPGDPAEAQSVGWYDALDLPQPQTISGGHLLAGLADGSSQRSTH
jgi:hypothetical protein